MTTDNLDASDRRIDEPRAYCGLIAPTMRALARQDGLVQAVVIVGNGEIFDLADWVGHPLIERWVLVRAGPDSLRGAVSAVPEIDAGQFDELGRLLGRVPQVAAWRHDERPRWSDQRQHWQLDSTGYPLIWASAIDAYVQLFPVAKAQFERFLASSAPPGMGDAWYSELLTLNPRTSFRSGTIGDYERLWMTGVTPDEAIAFARWMGPRYSLLTQGEWHACFEWLRREPMTAMPPALDACAPDARAIWDTITTARAPQTLLDVSLMSQGVFEWVVVEPAGPNPQYAGLGKTRAAFSSVLRPDVFAPHMPTRLRMRDFGFRLVKREAL